MRSNFVECRYVTNVKWLYFHTAGSYGHMIGRARSPTRIVHVDVTVTRSKVKVAGLLNVRKLPKSAKVCVYLLRHFRVELKTDG